ncbi:hypothetical protein [Ensifer adhaerens]|uniref:hypothetical protein n=1 Tax=Ensifer adhaerens TaxID=106592 RepID=UPI001C4DFEBC|nr:hypothetical protein [Ensifer adhaerens]MBW0369538.1 hypothetical protein [Ensifer adhaerens]UCM21349.1 hypothetical protein LDL63_07175 [Ensifer adhaerens]
MATVKSVGGTTSYYNIPDYATDLQDLIEHKRMEFEIGNIFKACYHFWQGWIERKRQRNFKLRKS